jgi:hypothetical protein
MGGGVLIINFLKKLLASINVNHPNVYSEKCHELFRKTIYTLHREGRLKLKIRGSARNENRRQSIVSCLSFAVPSQRYLKITDAAVQKPTWVKRDDIISNRKRVLVKTTTNHDGLYVKTWLKTCLVNRDLVFEVEQCEMVHNSA